MSDFGDDKRDNDLSKPFNPGARRDTPPVVTPETEQPVEGEVPEPESHLPEEDLPAVEPRMTHEAKTQEEEEAEANPKDAA